MDLALLFTRLSECLKVTSVLRQHLFIIASLVAMRNRPHILRNKVVDSKMAISREQIKATKSPQNTPRSPANKNFSRQKQSNNRQRARQPPKPSLSLSALASSNVPSGFRRQSNE